MRSGSTSMSSRMLAHCRAAKMGLPTLPAQALLLLALGVAAASAASSRDLCGAPGLPDALTPVNLTDPRAAEPLEGFVADAMAIFLNVSIPGTLPCPDSYETSILAGCSQIVAGMRWLVAFEVTCPDVSGSSIMTTRVWEPLPSSGKPLEVQLPFIWPDGASLAEIRAALATEAPPVGEDGEEGEGEAAPAPAASPMPARGQSPAPARSPAQPSPRLAPAASPKPPRAAPPSPSPATRSGVNAATFCGKPGPGGWSKMDIEDPENADRLASYVVDAMSEFFAANMTLACPESYETEVVAACAQEVAGENIKIAFDVSCPQGEAPSETIFTQVYVPLPSTEDAVEVLVPQPLAAEPPA